MQILTIINIKFNKFANLKIKISYIFSNRKITLGVKSQNECEEKYEDSLGNTTDK